MCSKLPKSNFRWLNNVEVDKFDLNAININDDDDDDDDDDDEDGINHEETGYILSVDLSYPEHLHDSHNDFPLAVESLTPTDDMLSEHQRQMKKKLGLINTTKKLIPNLYNKKNYITHIKNLKYYVRKGLIVTKIHKILSFTQSAWLKPYIKFNTEKRKQATTTVDKDNFKLMVNSVFGRSCMNPRKYRDIKIVHDKKRANTLVSKPNYGGFQRINEDFVAISMNKITIKWNVPTYTGMAILDLSKLIMYRFYYDVIKHQYGDNVSLLLMDTDSFLFHVYTKDIYKDMLKQLHLYDTSDYPQTHECYSEANKKKLGVFKDETNGRPAVEYVALKPKMYSLLLNENEDTSKCTAKGIKKSFVRKNLRHKSYVNCLKSEETTYASFYTIKSRNHQVRTKKTTKRCLCSFDDKRYIEKDNHKTLAFGHYKIS